MRKESGGKGKECAGKSVPFLYIDIVYNSIIEIGEIKVGKGMFIIYRYIERFFL